MMVGERRRTDRGLYSLNAVSAWVILALMLLFAGLSVALIALGGQAYRSILRASDENAQRRASIGYVTGRIHAFDTDRSVRVQRIAIDGETVDVLVLEEEVEGEAYQTRIYCAEGKLCEQFVAKDVPLESAEDGELIAALAGFEATLEPGMIELRFVHLDGNVDVVHAALHSGQEGAI